MAITQRIVLYMSVSVGCRSCFTANAQISVLEALGLDSLILEPIVILLWGLHNAPEALGLCL
jgi:hypothetical protein